MSLILSSTDVAASIYRAAFYAIAALTGEPLPEDDSIPDFSCVGESEMSQYMAVAQTAETILSQLEGSSIKDASKELFLRCSTIAKASENPDQAWEEASPEYRTTWEVITRHIWMMLDCDEITDLHSAESLWYDKAKSLLKR